MKHRICLTQIYISVRTWVCIFPVQKYSYVFISRGQFLGRLISVNIHVSGANIVHECEYICICLFTCRSNVLCYQSAFIPRYKFLHTNICPFMSIHWFLSRFVSLIFKCFLHIFIWIYLHLQIYSCMQISVQLHFLVCCIYVYTISGSAYICLHRVGVHLSRYIELKHRICLTHIYISVRTWMCIFPVQKYSYVFISRDQFLYINICLFIFIMFISSHWYLSIYIYTLDLYL